MEYKKTITSIFIFPTLKISKEKLIENGFINAYVGDIDDDHQYEDCIYLLFKPEDMHKMKDFVIREKDREPNLIDDYDYINGFVVLVYKLELKFIADYNLIMQSKYSKTSKEYQAMFSKIVKIMDKGLHKDELSIQYRVFNKTSDLVKFWEDKLDVRLNNEQEVWEEFNYHKETLNINKIIENEK